MNDLDDPAHARDLIAAYILDAATPDEVAFVKEHLSSCLLCRRLESELRDVVLTFPSLVPDRTPPASLKTRVLKAVEAEPRVAVPYRSDTEGVDGGMARTATVQSWLKATKNVDVKRRSTARLPVLLAAAVTCALAVLAVWIFLVRVPVSPSSKVYPVAGKAPMHSIAGSLCYTDGSTQATLNLAGLKQQDKNHVYELWLIRNGKPIGIKAFRPSANGHARVTFRAGKDFSSNNVAAITVEPAPFSKKPHLPVVAVAAIHA